MRTLKQWVGETAGGLPRPFWYLLANSFINRLGSFVFVLLAIYLTQQRGLPAALAGLIIGLWGAGGAVGTLVGGVLTDRWGRKPTLLTALYGDAALLLVLGLVDRPAVIAGVVLLLGVISEAARPAVTALMIDIVDERDRLRAFSLNYWVINLGFSFAAVTAGVVADMNFLALFVINAATTAVGATVIAIKVSEPPRRVVVSSGAPAVVADRGGLLSVFTDRVFMGYVAVNLLTAMVFMQHMSTLPMAMANDGLPASTFGSVIALNGILIVAGQLFIPRLVRGRDQAALLAFAALVTGVGFGLTAFADTAWLYGLTVLIWTVGEMLNSPSNATTNAELSPASARGRYQGVFSLSWSAAAFLAPVAGAAALQYAGDKALWLSCLAVSLLVALLHRRAAPARRARAAQLRAATAQADGVPARAAARPGVQDPRNVPHVAVSTPG